MILLDTHVWFYWVNDSLDELSPNALQQIIKSQTMHVNVISCWEIAMLVAKQRLKLNLDVQLWINRALETPGINLISIDPEIAVLSTRLPGHFHGDPADRLIAATALKYQVPLVTRDKKIHEWGHVEIIW